MSFLDLARNRYSCRDFDRNRAVSRNILSGIIETARLAPSACNRQPWTFVVIDDECEASCREVVIESYNRPWVTTAPAFIVACGNHEEAWHRKTTPMLTYQSQSNISVWLPPMRD